MRTAWLVLLAACGGEGKGGTLFDAPAMIDGAIDSSMGCTDETLPDPFDSQVDTQRDDIMIAALAICPATDKDRFTITTSDVKSVEVIATMTSGAVPMVQILNAGGASIANGTPMGTNATRACAANLPTGQWFASVTAAQVSEYRIAIAIVPGC
jgi:hypothetical protein